MLCSFTRAGTPSKLRRHPLIPQHELSITFVLVPMKYQVCALWYYVNTTAPRVPGNAGVSRARHIHMHSIAGPTTQTLGSLTHVACSRAAGAPSPRSSGLEQPRGARVPHARGGPATAASHPLPLRSRPHTGLSGPVEKSLRIEPPASCLSRRRAGAPAWEWW